MQDFQEISHVENAKPFSSSNKIQTLNKLYQEDGESYFSSKSTWINHESGGGSKQSDELPSELSLVFLDVRNFKAYTASMDHALLNEIKNNIAKKADRDFEAWVRQAFQSSSKDFCFSISEEEGGGESWTTKWKLEQIGKLETKFYLVWKKVEGKFKIRLGRIPIIPVADFGIAHAVIFEASLNQIEELNEKLLSTEQRQDSLKNNLREYRDTMIEFRDGKANLEEELYSAFLPILHSKQDEIRRLKQKVGELPGYKDDTSDESAATDKEDEIKGEPSKNSKIPGNGKGEDNAGNKELKSHDDSDRYRHVMSDSEEDRDEKMTDKLNNTNEFCDSQNFLDLSPA